MQELNKTAHECHANIKTEEEMAAIEMRSFHAAAAIAQGFDAAPEQPHGDHGDGKQEIRWWDHTVDRAFVVPVFIEWATHEM